MTELSFSDFQTLAQERSTCISIYMPAEKAGAETRKNPIRFKNALSAAESRLNESPAAMPSLRKPFKTAQSYIEQHDFWQHQDSGLAFFINKDGIKYYRLPYSFDEHVEVGDRFYLKPLLPVLSNNNKFYLLALSQNQVRFFLGSHYSINEIELPQGVPSSLAEALKYDDPEKQQQFHTASSGNSPVYHGQGVGTTDNKDEIKRFFQQIDNGLTSALQEEKTPLILAGVEFLLPIYHDANSYSNIIEQGITGNPENVDIDELHQQAWSIIEPHLAADKNAAIAQYNELANGDLASSQLEAIVAGAANGQIDTLIVRADAQAWGTYDRQANKVEVHATPTDNSIDLIDFATTQTYLQKGKVYLVDTAEMPVSEQAIAILRFPIFAESTTASA